MCRVLAKSVAAPQEGSRHVRVGHGSGPSTGRVGSGRVRSGHKIFRGWWVELGRVHYQKCLINMYHQELA